jgi:hypothetical protein
MKRVKTKTGGQLAMAEKGDVLNPNGRPKGALGIKATLKKLLAHEIDIVEAGEILKLPKKEAMLLLMIQRATDQDEDPAIQLKATQMILDRLQGKPKQPIKHSGDQDKPIKVQTDKLSLDELKVLTKLREKKI